MSRPIAEFDSVEISTTRRSPQLATHWRIMILIGLSFQTTAFVILRRYSSAIKKEKYDKSSVLLVAECIKLAISTGGILVGLGKSQSEELERITGDFELLIEEVGFARVGTLMKTSGPMAVQAVIYLAQNMLAFLALESIDGGTYSLLMQGKIFATAIFSIFMLSSSVSPRQWRSLMMLVLAVIQITSETKPTKSSTPFSSDTEAYMDGLLYTLINVLLSGFSTVFMEKTFKDTERDLTLWERNFQLAFCSIFVYSGLVFHSVGFRLFDNWSWYAVSISLVASVGGILVALSLKYTDSILKSMASTLAIVMTTGIEWAFMDGLMNLPIAIAAAFVILSVYNYNDSA
eukprot:c18555_g1_i1.p1 GENE.c18555_g1_i1~~c18555_g1_i1.p1  ORF type:complete len:361 (+),score=94.33 c18555_g1_i1:46-1083(+)